MVCGGMPRGNVRALRRTAERTLTKAKETEAMRVKSEDPRFPVGTVYHVIRHSRPGRPMEVETHTIIDILTTRNEAGEVVERRYVTEHEFCGRMVCDQTVTETSIAKSIDEFCRFQEWRRKGWGR